MNKATDRPEAVSASRRLLQTLAQEPAVIHPAKPFWCLWVESSPGCWWLRSWHETHLEASYEGKKTKLAYQVTRGFHDTARAVAV